ncbi:MAG: divergent polysaccharide deacetylase family protein [Roseovarius sp.]|uniref:divergent polysaccharide deacteylase family protein n=1 Tax=Roseovarius sp. TaxID=1486281 RepID=UPI001B735A25|nr:divergent polysaccharide deacteylase family protein [Roseovarius sp.]MBQ0751261.1 divergent polysaccharide deacetylase family protein [Roseovarius sp.]MBQ0810414.1 divergent polysaccharide deacetylase family protein [Roseovarius sp.]
MMTGTLVSGLALGTLSVLSGAPGEAPPEAVSLEVPAGSGFDLRREDAEADLPAAQRAPEVAGVSQVAPPAPDDSAGIGAVETAPAAAPETGDVAALAEAPTVAVEGAGVTVESDDPVLPSPQGTPPVVPSSEGAVAVSTDPAQPPAPAAAEESAGLSAPEGAEAGSIFPEEEPAPVLIPDASGTEGVTDMSPEAEAQAEAAPVPEADAEATPKTLPALGTIGNRAEGVTTNRLPSLGAPAPEVVERVVEPEVAPEVAGALARNQVAFDNPEGKPLMAIILMDDGQSPIGIEALQSFPYPLNFAVDVDWSGAAAAAERYRAAGFEVLAMADLPEGARPEDAEVAMQAWFAEVPQAVAVLEGTSTGLQSSREATAQLAPILKESGHGLVMHPNGLNTAQKLMAREGVPSASLFRDFDGQGQNAAAIRRFLDQAAMRADQQEDGVIMLGRLRADTISALLLWGLQDRAASVALAPVSAVLRAE